MASFHCHRNLVVSLCFYLGARKTIRKSEQREFQASNVLQNILTSCEIQVQIRKTKPCSWLRQRIGGTKPFAFRLAIRLRSEKSACSFHKEQDPWILDWRAPRNHQRKRQPRQINLQQGELNGGTGEYRGRKKKISFFSFFFRSWGRARRTR